MTTAGDEWQEWLSQQTEFTDDTWNRAMSKIKELQEKYGVGKNETSQG